MGIGGTAIGTGITAHPKFHETIVKELNKLTSLNLKTSKNLIELTSNYNSFANFSSSLRLLASTLFRISNNLSLLNSGPNAGICEITLPDVEPGSSIMPGKINPSIPECMIMICFDVMGKDKAVELSSQYSILELNVMCPVITKNILDSIKILTNGLKMFRTFCIEGLEADKKRCEELLFKSTAAATALNPYIGYQAVSKIVKEALKENKSVKEIILKYGLIDDNDLSEMLSPEKMTKPVEIDLKLIEKIKSSKEYIEFVKIL